MAVRYLEVIQVAKRLSVSATTVYRLITAGTLPARNHGPKKCIRVAETDLKKFMAV